MTRSVYFLKCLAGSLAHELARWEGLEAKLAELVGEALAEFGHIPVPEEAFLGYLAGRLPDEGRVAAPTLLEELRPADLYLACACLRGAPEAIAAFEERYVPLIGAALRRSNLDEGLQDETIQRVRRKLLVGDDGEPPRLIKYSGRGSLAAWVRVVAVREARDQLRREKRYVPVGDEAQLERAAPAGDPELALLKEAYREEFGRAVRQAFSSLGARERNLLRHHYVDGLNIDEIGRSHGVHRATAARWLAGAREALRAAILEELRRNLDLGSQELESVMRLVVSQLHVTLSLLFRPPE